MPKSRRTGRINRIIGAIRADDVRSEAPALRPINPATPVMNSGRDRDWAWRCSDPEGGWNPYGWNSQDQARFAAVWCQEADDLVDELVDRYGAMWVWRTPAALLTRLPEVAERVRDLAERQLVGQQHTYRGNPTSIYEQASLYGPFHTTRQRRSWPDPLPQPCPLCGHWFTAGQLNPWILRQFGPPRWCKECCLRARNGNTAPSTPDCAREAVTALASALGTIPAQSYASTPVPLDLPADRRDALVAAMAACPPATAIRALLGAASWLEVLLDTKVVTGAWRPARGTYCLAADGHPCRSLGERAVDDWLTRHGLPHELEPTWPHHPELNPSGRMRADWRLADGTYVEYAGLTSDDYLAKLHQKRQLARATGIPLVVITPADLADLTALFGRWLQAAT